MRNRMGLRASITTLLATVLLIHSVAQSAPVPPPPGAPSWWNQTDTPFYSFYKNQNGVVTLSSNEGTGFPITLEQSGTQVTIDMPNGYDPTLYKRFYFYIEGTTAGTTDPTFISITGPNNVPPTHPDSVTVGTFDGHTDVAPNPNTFFVSFLGTSTPQPDRVIFKFNLPSATSTITTWWAGEQCLPEPAAAGLISVLMFGLFSRRRQTVTKA